VKTGQVRRRAEISTSIRGTRVPKRLACRVFSDWLYESVHKLCVRGNHDFGWLVGVGAVAEGPDAKAMQAIVFLYYIIYISAPFEGFAHNRWTTTRLSSRYRGCHRLSLRASWDWPHSMACSVCRKGSCSHSQHLVLQVRRRRRETRDKGRAGFPQSLQVAMSNIQ